MEIKPNKGVIFKNTKKTSDKHPEYRGEINVETPGLKEISLWVNTDKNGNKYFSVSISEPYKKEAEPPASDYEKTGKYDSPPPPLAEQSNEPDDLPFIITILLMVGTFLPQLF